MSDDFGTSVVLGGALFAGIPSTFVLGWWLGTGAEFAVWLAVLSAPGVALIGGLVVLALIAVLSRSAVQEELEVAR